MAANTPSLLMINNKHAMRSLDFPLREHRAGAFVKCDSCFLAQLNHFIVRPGNESCAGVGLGSLLLTFLSQRAAEPPELTNLLFN